MKEGFNGSPVYVSDEERVKRNDTSPKVKVKVGQGIRIEPSDIYQDVSEVNVGASFTSNADVEVLHPQTLYGDTSDKHIVTEEVGVTHVPPQDINETPVEDLPVSQNNNDVLDYSLASNRNSTETVSPAQEQSLVKAGNVQTEHPKEKIIDFDVLDPEVTSHAPNEGKKNKKNAPVIDIDVDRVDSQNNPGTSKEQPSSSSSHYMWDKLKNDPQTTHRMWDKSNERTAPEKQASQDTAETKTAKNPTDPEKNKKDTSGENDTSSGKESTATPPRAEKDPRIPGPTPDPESHPGHYTWDQLKQRNGSAQKSPERTSRTPSESAKVPKEYLDEHGPGFARGAKRFFKAVATPFTFIAKPFYSLAEKGVKAVGGFTTFQAERARTYSNLVLTQFLENRRGVKFEGQKAKLKLADAEVTAITDELQKIDNTKRENQFLTPRDARYLEKRKRKLEFKLINAREYRDQRLRKTTFQRDMVVKHENKKQLIAEQFAQFVDERLKPYKERFDALAYRKDVLTHEVEEFSRVVDESMRMREVIEKEIRESDNPKALRKKFGDQLHEFSQKIKVAQQQVKVRKQRILSIDGGVFGLNRTITKLDKYEVKKKAYQTFAAQRLPDELIGENSLFETTPAYRDVFKGQVNKDSVDAPKPPRPDADVPAPDADAPAAGDGAGADTPPDTTKGNENPAGTEGGSTETRESQIELRTAISKWNSLHGSVLKLSLDTFIVAEHNNIDEVASRLFRKDGFAGLILAYINSSRFPKGGKKLTRKQIDKMLTSMY